MKLRVSVANAEPQIREIAYFIECDNPEAAARYAETAARMIHEIPENRLPVRASEHLSGDVRKVPVPGFPGYALRQLFRGEHIGLVAAFRPGMTRAMQDRATRAGLDEFSEDYP